MAQRARRDRPVRRRVRERGPEPEPYVEDELPADPDERREAGRALASAYRTLKQLRVIFVIDAVFVAIALLVAFSLDSVLAQVIVSVLFLAAVAGAIYVIRYPIPATITLAVVHTPPALLAIGLSGGGIGRILVMGLAAVIWLCVPMVFRTRKIMQRYPDLWAARMMRGERRDPRQVGRKYRAQAQAHRKQRLGQVLLFGVLPLVLLIVGANVLLDDDDTGSGVYARPSVRPLPTILRFHEAWNASKHEDVKAHIADDQAIRLGYLLDKSLRRKGWDEALPSLGAPELTKYDAWRYTANFEIDGYGLLKTSWVWEDARWGLTRIGFKKSD